MNETLIFLGKRVSGEKLTQVVNDFFMRRLSGEVSAYYDRGDRPSILIMLRTGQVIATLIFEHRSRLRIQMRPVYRDFHSWIILLMCRELIYRLDAWIEYEDYIATGCETLDWAFFYRRFILHWHWFGEFPRIFLIALAWWSLPKELRKAEQTFVRNIRNNRGALKDMGF